MLIKFVIALSTVTVAQAKDYENFDLPKTAPAPLVSKINYKSRRVELKGRNVRLKEPSVDHKEFLYAKEAFLAEKRDQAIKLLRQELDSGMKANLDNMLLRLGQLYAEKYMELSYHEGEVYTREIEEYERRKAADKSAKQPKMDNHRSQQYLKDSLAIFYRLEKEYPKHPKIDEVVYFIGFVEMEMGNRAKGAAYLDRVIRQYPRSRKFEEAVVYLADNYFDNQKFRDAYAKYRILLKRPDSDLHFYARYKLAWCEMNAGEQRRGLETMKSLVGALKGTTEKAKFNLREQALKDLVIFFAEVDAVQEAFAYFEEAQGKEKSLENLRLIADILRSKARDEAAVKAYTRLLEAFPDSPDAPLMQLGIYESLMRLGRTVAAIDTMVKTVNRYGATSDWAKDFPKEKASDLKATLDTLQAEAEKAALFQHQSAQKSSNKKSYDHALRLYSALLASFPQHPSRKNISFYRAEILFQQGKWIEASDAYMDAAKIPPKDKLTDESVYNALLALDRLTVKSETMKRYTKEEQKKVSLDKEDIPEGEQKFIEVAGFYLKEYPQGQRVVDVKFRIGAIYYRHHHFDEAMTSFKEIALKHSRHRSAATAAHIVLDILNIRKEYAAMNDTARLFASTEGLGDKAFKTEMAKIAGEIGFKNIEKLEAENKWAEAAEAYMKAYRSDPSGSLAEKSLYNAFVSYEKAKDAAKASDTSRVFIAKFPKSEYAQKMTLALAKNAERLYDFEEAQKRYLDFSRKYPKDKDARRALYNSAVFAELLEKNREALGLYESYMKGGAVTPEEKKAITISQAKLYRRTGDWEKMNLMYRRLIRDARGVDEKLLYLGELARQYERGGKMADRNAVMNEIRWMADSSPNAKPSGPAVAYIAEARFRALAPQREKYNGIKLRFPPEDLLYLMNRKQKSLVKISEGYDKVVEVGVPEWGVAALFEKGEAFLDYVKSYRAVVIPKNYKDALRTEAEAAVKKIDDQKVKPLEAKAEEIFKACVERAVSFHVASDYAGKCRDRLKKADGFPDPKGLSPRAAYWSMRPPAEEVAGR